MIRIYSINPGLLNHSADLLSFPSFQAMTLTVEKLNEVSSPVWMWRGDLQRSGVSQQSLRLPLKISWQSRQLNFSIHTAAKSSPAVDDTGLFVGADTGWFYAFDHTGHLNWRFLFSNAARGVHGTAVLDKNNIYIGAYNGKFYCLDKDTGSPRWIAKLADAIGSSALIDGDFIYVSAETGPSRRGILYKLRRDNGELVWQSEWMDGQIHSSPTMSIDKKLIFLGSNSFQLTAFHAENGSIAWKRNLGGEIKGAPAVNGDTVYAASWARKLAALSLIDGQILWQAPLDGIAGSSPVVLSDLKMVIVNSLKPSRLKAISFSGSEIWSADLNSRFSYGSAVAADSPQGTIVLVTCGKSDLCVYRALDGAQLQKINLGKGFSSTPAVHGGSVYISLENGGVIRLDSTSK